MKSKLVRYPFNDGKRYRWDTYQMGKKFEYSWDESIPQNFETITPYIKAESMATAYDDTKAYALVDLEKEITEYDPDNYQDISGLEWEINETGDYQISEASAVMDDILPLDDIRYVAYVITYARQRDNNSYSGYKPLPSGWQEISHGNKVYENGEWRTARRELHDYSESIQIINGVPYSDVLVYHEYSPRGQLIMDVDSNTHELRFYDPDGNLEYTQEFNLSARRGTG